MKKIGDFTCEDMTCSLCPFGTLHHSLCLSFPRSCTIKKGYNKVKARIDLKTQKQIEKKLEKKILYFKKNKKEKNDENE